MSASSGSKNESPTQRELILRELLSSTEDWVPMPRLAEVSGAYAVHSRVAELRRKGFVIDCRLKGYRPRKSFYRLIL
jgi:hypothetical protein